jgi:hypothetical protein
VTGGGVHEKREKQERARKGEGEGERDGDRWGGGRGWRGGATRGSHLDLLGVDALLAGEAERRPLGCLPPQLPLEVFPERNVDEVDGLHAERLRVRHDQLPRHQNLPGGRGGGGGAVSAQRRGVSGCAMPRCTGSPTHMQSWVRVAPMSAA